MTIKQLPTILDICKTISHLAKVFTTNTLQSLVSNGIFTNNVDKKNTNSKLTNSTTSNRRKKIENIVFKTFYKILCNRKRSALFYEVKKKEISLIIRIKYKPGRKVK